MTQQLDAIRLGYAGGIVGAAGMLVLGVLANIGIYTGAAEQMMRWHMFFGLGIGGIITGMIEAAVISFVFLWAVAALYNRMVH